MNICIHIYRAWFRGHEVQIKYGNGDMQWGFRGVSGANCRRQTQQTIIYIMLYLYTRFTHIANDGLIIFLHIYTENLYNVTMPVRGRKNEVFTIKRYYRF